MKMRDYSGRQFGRLTALKFAGRRENRLLWSFKCSCGKEKIILLHSVTSGLTKSCGCLHREISWKNLDQTVHGDSRKGNILRIHCLWRDMLKRCQPKAVYGKEGIHVCDEWKDYLTFKKWAMDNGYQDDLSIDRIDGNLGYFPGNCRWVTKKDQARNRRTSRFLTYNGIQKTLAEWAEDFRISQSLLWARIYKLKWPIDIAITKPADFSHHIRRKFDPS